MERVRSRLVIYQGEALEFAVQWNDDDGAAVDLTDATVRSQIRQSYFADDPILTLASDGEGSGSGDGLVGTIEIEPEERKGLVVLRASAETTSEVEMRGEGVFDIELTPKDGEPVRIAEGVVELSREATR